MSPERKKTIGTNKVEEYYWAGKMAVYVNNYLTEGTFEEVCARLEAAEKEVKPC